MKFSNSNIFSVSRVAMYGAVTQVVMAITLLLISRQLSSRDLGLYGLSIAASASIYMILDLGDEAYCYREIASSRMSWNSFKIRIKRKIQVSILFLLIAAFAISLLWYKPKLIFLIVVMSILQIVETSLHTLLKSKSRIVASAKLEFAKRCFQFALIVIIPIFDRLLLEETLAIFIVTQLFGICLVTPLAIKIGQNSFVEDEETKIEQQKPWNGSAGFAQVSLLRFLSSTDQYIISILFGVENYGSYFLIKRVIMPSGLLFTAGNQYLFPAFSRSGVKRGDYWTINKEIWQIYLIATVPLLAILINSHLVLDILIGEPNLQQISLLQWLILANLLQMSNTNFGVYLQATYRESLVAKYGFISFLVNLLILLILGLWGWTIESVGYALFLSQIFLLFMYVVKFGRVEFSP